VAFSPDGDRLAAFAADETLRVWDTATGIELFCLRDQWGTVAFSPDGSRLASSACDNSVRVLDAATGAQILCLRGHESLVGRLAFSRDGRALASCAAGHNVRLWDMTTGNYLGVTLGAAGAAAFAAIEEGGIRYPWVSLNQIMEMETVVHETTSLRPIAWFPEAIAHLSTHSSGRIWAGSLGSYLCLFTLEGGEHIDRSRQTESFGLTDKVEAVRRDKAIGPSFWQRLWARTRKLLKP